MKKLNIETSSRLKQFAFVGHENEVEREESDSSVLTREIIKELPGAFHQSDVTTDSPAESNRDTLDSTTSTPLTNKEPERKKNKRKPRTNFHRRTKNEIERKSLDTLGGRVYALRTQMGLTQSQLI